MTSDDFAPPPLADGTHPATASAPRAGHVQAGGGAGVVQPGPQRGRRGSSGGKRGSNGRWVFVTMIAAIGLILGGIAWASVLNYRSSGVKPADASATGSLHTGQVVSGMCIKDAPDSDAAPGPVTVVHCSDPHHAEALVSYTFTTGSWPGTEQARGEVGMFCATQVDPSAGHMPVSPDGPNYDWIAWVPSANTWNLGDRTGVCVVTTERPVAGSYGAGTAHDATEDAVVG